ncbi:hypothetical protein [Devosia sp. CN2-171]|uniref:hypothetical protein n=1 Tax=Devosia sp. CN2-171 TaxID=3400909 RepID=UPI003BF81AA7
MLLETYYRHVSQVRSINSINQINIAFGNTITPQEVVDLEGALFTPGHVVPELRGDRFFSDEELKATAREWIEDAFAHLQLVGKAEAEPFLRRDLRKSMTFYTDGGQANGKTLVVAFPGANNRLMMPVATLLQALDASKVDIVLIRDPTHSAYLKGLEDFADSRDGLFDALPSYLNFAAYARVSSLGVSAGGLPALLLASRLGLTAVLACGADSPLDPRLHEKGGAAAAAALRSAAESNHRSHVAIVFGAQHPEDREAATEIGGILGVEPLEISNAAHDVRHNVLVPLAEEGRLSSFLAEHLRL